jgi:hypothetical protein
MVSLGRCALGGQNIETEQVAQTNIITPGPSEHGPALTCQGDPEEEEA